MSYLLNSLMAAFLPILVICAILTGCGTPQPMGENVWVGMHELEKKR